MTEIKKEGKTKFYLVMQLILSILCVGGIISSVAIMSIPGSTTVVYEALNLLIYALIVIYFLFVYKRPHTNFLKYTIFIFVLITAYNGLAYQTISKAQSYTLILISIIFAYVSGRLNRYNKNRWLLLFGFVLLLGSTIYSVVNVSSEVIANYSSLEKSLYYWSYFSTLLQYVSLSLAYLARCYKHVKLGKIVDAEDEI